MRLGVWMPFDRAVREFEWFCGATGSEASARRLTEAAGAAYVAVQTAEAERIATSRPRPPTGPTVQQLSADGAMVPLTHGQWAEVKLAAIGTVDASRADDGEPIVHTGEVSYFARMADHDTFGQQALCETHRRGTETAGIVVAVVDGSDWLQGFIDLHRSDAVRILDFPHALEHLNIAGQATFGVGTASATAWLAAQAHELKTGDPDVVLEALRALPIAAAADPDAAALARDQTLGYFEKRRAQIDYARFRRCGFPIASGMVESGHKNVVEDRLKGAGMHWASTSVNPMVALRTAVCADRWDEAWSQITNQLRAQARDRPTRRCSPRGLSAHQAGRPTPGPRPPRLPRITRVPRTLDGRPSTRSWRHAFQPHRRAADLAAKRASGAASAKI